jgi:hypothetical protein
MFHKFTDNGIGIDLKKYKVFGLYQRLPYPDSKDLDYIL